MSNTIQPANSPVEILIADSSPMEAQRLRNILEEQGYRVTHAPNGQAALEAALRGKPRLIISDASMPEMDGFELCRRVKSDPGLADTAFILATNLADAQDVIRGLECRADNFIPKPHDENFLLSRVQSVLVSREVRREDDTGGIEVLFNGQRHFITADRLRILNLLLSTYEDAVERNAQLSDTQEQVHQLTEKLEMSNKELDAFSFSISHDLRAPLRNIRGFAGLLRASAAGKLGEEERTYLATIVGSADRMGRLIEDLLNFSHLGSTEMRRTAVDLNVIVRDVIRELEADIKGRKVVWKVGALPAVRADPAMIRQVFVNLLGNAVKFSRTREVAEIAVDSRDDPKEIVFFVRDNGVGFNMSYADRLFGVFQRLHSTDQFEGTGVGLAHVRRIVSRHDGRTWAEAKEGEWAAFYFSLPKGPAGV